jgi:hypothetical protein
MNGSATKPMMMTKIAIMSTSLPKTLIRAPLWLFCCLC